MNARIRLIVVIAAIAVAVPFVTGAGTLPGAHPMRPVYVSGLVRHYHAPRLVPGETLTTSAELAEVLGQPGAPTVYPTPAARTARPAARRIPGAIENILEGVAGGVLADSVVYASKTLFKLVKKYVWKGTGKHTRLYQNTGDGRCMADFGRGLTAYLANCNDKTGIYWSYSSEGKLWDNLTGDMLTASSNNNGTKLYDWYPPHDWYRWTWGELCANSSCSKIYGVYWALYNSQSHMISDTTASSVG